MGTNLWLNRFAVLVAACTLVLIFVGGLVTSTGSGLSVPDWPLSYGQFFPEMVGGILYEHSHRLVAAAVGFLTLIQAIWLWRREPRKWVCRLGGLALLAVILQGIVGGITVLFLLPTAVSVTHAGLAQIFFCLTVCVAVFTSSGWLEEMPRLEDLGNPSLRSLTATTTVVIYIQVLTGALMRHTGSGLAIPDFPLAYGQLIPPFFTRQILVHFTHRVGALLVIFLIIWSAWRILQQCDLEKALRRPYLQLIFSLGVQIFLGAETIWSSRATIPTTLHVAGGALMLASSLYLTLCAYRILLPRHVARPAPAACVNAARE